MNVRAVASTLISAALLACSSSGGGGTPDGGGSNQDAATNPGGTDAGGGSGDSGTPVGTGDAGGGTGDAGGTPKPDAGSGPKVDAGGGGGTDAGGGGTDAGSGGAWAPPFAAGTVCNSSGTKVSAPATLKNLIVVLMENENYGSVNGSAASAPYMAKLAGECGVATAYNDTCFGNDNLVSLPHYLALTSGSNCNTGNDSTGTGCITDDNDVGSHTLSTTSIFSQVASWKSYQEAMPSACDPSSSGGYAAKHNPAAYFTSLSNCSANDVSMATVTCSTKVNTLCTPAPTTTNPFVADLQNDTLAQFTFITPTLTNDMHDGTITQGDNWLSTYVPLMLASPAYLRGDVAIFILWDEQNTLNVGGPTPNVILSPYITAGSTTATAFNHYAMLRAWEEALGITTFLGCASGTAPGGVGTCPAGSTTEVRPLLNF